MSMYPKNMLFTSESVTEGHPDKFCDQQRLPAFTSSLSTVCFSPRPSIQPWM
jgi:hypothetical protein